MDFTEIFTLHRLEKVGAFHDRSTKKNSIKHHHDFEFDFDKVLSIRLSRALKSMVSSRDLKGQRFLIYSLGQART